MKRIVLILLLVASSVMAQTLPYVKMQPGQGRFFLDDTYFTWKTVPSAADTVLVSPHATLNTYTRTFTVPNGFLRVSGTAVLTAGTDSFKIIALGTDWDSDTVKFGSLDTTLMVRLDSTKVLAAGAYTYVFSLAGKFFPYICLEYVALNKAATRTGKSLNTRISLQ